MANYKTRWRTQERACHSDKVRQKIIHDGTKACQGVTA